jgi:hypothetical protein
MLNVVGCDGCDGYDGCGLYVVCYIGLLCLFNKLYVIWFKVGNLVLFIYLKNS